MTADEEHELVVAARGFASRAVPFQAGPNKTKELTVVLFAEETSRISFNLGG